MYIIHKSLSIEFNPENGSVVFSLADAAGICVPFVRGGVFLSNASGVPIPLTAFPEIQPSSPLSDRPISPDVTLRRILFSGAKDYPEVKLQFHITGHSVAIECLSDGLNARFEGQILWGDNPVAARTEKGNGRGMAPVSGAAFGLADNALFDRGTDQMLEFCQRNTWDIKFNYTDNLFTFGKTLSPEAKILIHRDWLTGQYGIKFHPIGKEHEFKAPPVGWMTWYAVKFNACEQVVLENARLMKEFFGDYLDQMVIWVDWEWCHRNYSGNIDTDIFSPRRDAYPNGLDGLASEISRMGLIPALWCAPCHDERKNPLMKRHPEWVLGQWNGLWYIDSSHPGTAGKYIPRVFRKLQQWGYKAFKWDFLYHYRYASEALHEKKYYPELSDQAAFRRLCEAARKSVGPKTFMLFCAILSDHDLAYSLGNFDAMRIGGDVFTWEEFSTNVCQRLLRYYPYHNAAFYADGDNLILRSEFNTEAQARSRVSLYGLTGLPITCGDRLAELDSFRIDLLRRIMPVVNFSSRPLCPQEFQKGSFLVQCAISRHFGSWIVAGLFNFGKRIVKTRLALGSELGLEPGNYAVYDYWDEKFVGVFHDEIAFQTAPCDTTVLRITPYDGTPTLISSSRHITQGGVEMEDIRHSDGMLSGRVKCVKEAPLRLTVLIPPEMEFIKAACTVSFQTEIRGKILVLTLMAPENISVDWELSFCNRYNF